jgi:2,3-bisphosphoglycerate-dependent phosphoglycerate mutase
MKLRLLLLIVLCTVVHARAQQKITTLILVRHAEKANDGTNDPDLTEAGQQRSQVLRVVLKETHIDAIYSTKYKRTRSTVQPLAEEKHVATQFYEAFKVEEIDRIIKAHLGGTVVIAGHSNNVPWIANILTNTEKYTDWKDSDYDNLLVVSVVERGKTASVIWLNYGAPSN